MARFGEGMLPPSISTGKPRIPTRPPEDIYIVVRQLAAAVEPLIHDDRVLVGLGVEVALERLVPRAARVRYVHVRHPARGGGVHLAEVPLDPGAVPERGLVGDRHHL